MSETLRGTSPESRAGTTSPSHREKERARRLRRPLARRVAGPCPLKVCGCEAPDQGVQREPEQRHVDEEQVIEAHVKRVDGVRVHQVNEDAEPDKPGAIRAVTREHSADDQRRERERDEVLAHRLGD